MMRVDCGRALADAKEADIIDAPDGSFEAPDGSTQADDGAESGPTTPVGRWNPVRYLRRSWRRHRVFWAFGIWLLVSGYFVASLALRRKTHISDLLPLIAIYAFVSGKMLLAFTGTARVSTRVAWASGWIMERVRLVPRAARYAVATAALVAAALAVSLGLPDNASGTRIERMQSLLGIVVITALLTLTSRHPRWIPWRTVIAGFMMQFCVGCVVARTRWGGDFFGWVSSMAQGLLAFAGYGARFLFGDDVGSSVVFAMSVFPAFIFFAAFVQVVCYLGGVQWLLRNLGQAFQVMLGTSGAESVVAAAAPLVGQSEGMLLVRDCLEHVTLSEIHAFLTAGFATVSGSTLQGYIALGVDSKSIITSCAMSIPCSLALSKIRWPETDEPLTRGTVVLPARSTDEANLLHAMSNGAAIGMQLSLMIAANLIAVISLVQLADFLLGWLGQFVGIAGLTLEQVLGYVLYPYAWLLGVPRADVSAVAQLLGLKFVANEFVAYQRLGDTSGGRPSMRSTLTTRGRLIAELALCGFGNLGGIAQQIGLAGSLAPSRKAEFSRVALSACITGSIATTMTAAVISIVV
ncbi:hypothetical protein LPJ61_002778 [Coemansia biformis]|uniref:Sodium/nucleoside cotransporter n=1 Tax=Coemansia biformis TaxID=1286918 RepID=A0A9W7YE48_9FUNG|nr:hypothetical protein LPJ61_002778 [Coemansia biformis]